MPPTPTISTSGTSFKDYAQQDAPRRLIVGLDAMERMGKTHFAFSAPGTLAYLQMDPGGDDVLPKAKRLYPKKRILHAKYYVDVKPGTDRQGVANLAQSIWAKTVQDFELILAELDKERGTLIVDTASEWYTCLKLARFGKLTQVMPEDYAPVNTEYKRLLRMIYNYNVNAVFIHRLKAEYDRPAGGENKKGQGKKTGNMIRDGFNGTGYEMQINARAFKQDGKFYLNVQDCRQNPDLDDMDIEMPEKHGFAELAQLVYPDTDLADWTY